MVASCCALIAADPTAAAAAGRAGRVESLDAIDADQDAAANAAALDAARRRHSPHDGAAAAVVLLLPRAALPMPAHAPARLAHTSPVPLLARQVLNEALGLRQLARRGGRASKDTQTPPPRMLLNRLGGRDTPTQKIVESLGGSWLPPLEDSYIAWGRGEDNTWSGTLISCGNRLFQHPSHPQLDMPDPPQTIVVSSGGSWLPPLEDSCIVWGGSGTPP